MLKNCVFYKSTESLGIILTITFANFSWQPLLLWQPKNFSQIRITGSRNNSFVLLAASFASLRTVSGVFGKLSYKNCITYTPLHNFH